jgi:CheB methylesterase
MPACQARLPRLLNRRGWAGVVWLMGGCVSRLQIPTGVEDPLAAISYSSRRHDIVVLGGSGGGLKALRTILARLPADLPAAVFVVIHLRTVSYLTLQSKDAVVPEMPRSALRHVDVDHVCPMTRNRCNFAAAGK